MAAETFRIEIPIHVEDNTDPGVSSAKQKMTKFDEANQKTQERLDKMNRTKWQIALNVVDKVSTVVSSVGSSVKSLAGKAWSVTLKAVDKITSVATGIISKLTEILSIGTMISTVLGGITLSDMLDSADEQLKVETQLSTVLKNMADSAEEAEATYDRIIAKASELQGLTLYGDEAYIAGAAELATYFSDADALELMMETLADYATGMSGGAELTTEELVEYATNLGKITTGAYDAMTKKGFEFTEAQEAVIDGTASTAQYIEALGEDWESLSEEMRVAQVISDVIEESWSGLAEEMASLPSAKITQFKNAWGDVKEVIGNKLYPAVGDFFAMLTDKLPAVQELLESGADWLNEAFEDLIPDISNGIDTAIRWVNKLAGTVKDMVNSKEWQNADLFGKVKIAWDTLIAEPFSEWWQSTGKAWFEEKAGEIGDALGSGITKGLLALLGFDLDDAESDGSSVGSAFLDGFKEGFDTDAITEALENWADEHKEALIAIGAVVGVNLLAGLGSKISDISSLFSSSKTNVDLGDIISSTTTMTVTASVVNVYGAVVTSSSAVGTAAKVASTGAKYLLGDGSKAAQLLLGTSGTAASTATGTGLTSASSWLSKLLLKGSTDAVIGADGTLLGVSGGVGGTLGSIGSALGSTATTAAGTAAAGVAGVAGIAGLVAGGISSIVDVVQGVKASQSGDSKTAKDEYITAGTKAGMMATGAGIGAAIGSIVPGLGTGIGALVGGGIGGIVSLFAGNKAGKAISDSTDEGGALSNAWQATKTFFQEDVSNFFKNTLPTAWNSFWGSVGNFFTQTIPQWWGNLTGTVSDFFTVTIPEKWSEFWESVRSFFTETVPYAIGYATGKVVVFFTETVPGFFSNLWDSIAGFFTDTLPTWVGNIWNNHVVPFFTDTLPEFVGEIWENIKTFFTDTLPTWASGIWNDHIVPFFTESIPQFFSDIWGNLTTFFTDTLPTWASDMWNNHIVPFFTEDIPEFISMVWDNLITFFTDTIPTWASDIWNNHIVVFFTETVPQFFSDIWDSVTSLFTEAIPQLASEIWSSITGWFSGIGDWFGEIWSSVKSSFSSGYSDATSEHAWGGIMNSPHLGMVAEDGPEAIIPLSSSKSTRGIDLWMKAGQYLGVQPYAEGDIVGDVSSITSDTSGSGATGCNVFEINMEVNPVFQIEGSDDMDEETIVAIIKARIKEMVDGIADELAERLARIFANMPVKGSA